MPLSFQLFVLAFVATAATTFAAPKAARSTYEWMRDSDGDWSYAEPELWPHEYCSGQRQSPVDISPSKTIDVKYPSFEFRNYNKMFPVNITLDGVTVKVLPSYTMTDEEVPSITGGGLKGRYNFAQFHFHWGSVKDNGSEHTVSSKAYAAEMHLVHYKSDYGNLTEALNHEDGVAALSVLVQEENNVKDMDIGPLNHLGELFQMDGDLPQVVQSTILPLEQFLQTDLEDFYRYSGSLTTPYCQEVVTWTVFSHPIVFSKRQLDRFRNVEGTDGLPLLHNTRPTQPLNGRVVVHRKNPRA